MSTASWESNYNRFKIINWLLFNLVWLFVVSEKINYYWLFLVCVYFFLFSWWSPAMLWHAIGFDGWLIVHQYLSGFRDLELVDQFSILISTWISIAGVIALTLLNPQFFFMAVRKLKVALNPMYIFQKTLAKVASYLVIKFWQWKMRLTEFIFELLHVAVKSKIKQVILFLW